MVTTQLLSQAMRVGRWLEGLAPDHPASCHAERYKSCIRLHNRGDAMTTSKGIYETVHDQQPNVDAVQEALGADVAAARRAAGGHQDDRRGVVHLRIHVQSSPSRDRLVGQAGRLPIRSTPAVSKTCPSNSRCWVKSNGWVYLI